MGTKAGIDHVVRAVANQYGKNGIRVNCIAAGHTDTPMHHANFGGGDIPPWMKAAFAAEYPLGRYGTIAEFGATAAFVASQHASYMTGAMIRLDGGIVRSW